jgi:hypothetical protein
VQEGSVGQIMLFTYMQMWCMVNIGASVVNSFSRMQHLRKRGHIIPALMEVTTHVVRRRPVIFEGQ